MRKKDFNKIDLIFTAVLRLINKCGIAGLTMAKIAKEARIATGTLYIYFKNKDELINAMYVKYYEEANHRFLDGYNPNKEFVGGIKRVWTNYLFHRIENHEASIFLEQYYRSPYISSKQKKMAEEMKQPIYQLINRGKAEGFISETYDTEMIFSALIGFLREMADEHVEGRYKLGKDNIQKAFLISWNMVKK